jgi:hypothetical protein
MSRRHAQPLLCLVLAAGLSCPARAADTPRPSARPPTDAAKTKANELEKLRLIAKLHAEAPKLVESHGANPLDAPIFHRYDRP